MGLDPNGEGRLRPDKSSGWSMEMREFSITLRKLVLESEPGIFDQDILAEYEYISRLLLTASQDLPSVRPKYVDEEIRTTLKRRCQIMNAVLKELRKFRSMMTSKSDRRQCGNSRKYDDIRDRLPESELPY